MQRKHYIHTYTRTFIKRLLTKRIQSAIGKGKTQKKIRQEPKKRKPTNWEKMTLKRLFEKGSGGSASDHGREVVP